MADISGFGLSVTLRASTTFPAGISITEFADDADPLDLASIQVADDAMGLNGDLLKWSNAMAIPAILNVIPNGTDDRLLSLLAELNRVGKGKTSARDVVTMVVSYPDGRKTTLTNGFIRDAMRGNSIASAGRLKTKAYVFRFENILEL